MRIVSLIASATDPSEAVDPSEQFVLATRDGRTPADDEALAQARFTGVRDKTKEELLADQRRLERSVKRYEHALRLGVSILNRRRQ